MKRNVKSRFRKGLAWVLTSVLVLSCLATLPASAEGGAFYVAPDQGTSGYYTTLADAVKAVNEGGVIKLVKDHASSSREQLYQTEGAKKSFTLDGKLSETQNATWRASASCFKIGGSGKRVSVTNVTFDLGSSYAGQIFEIDGANTLVLGDGVRVVATGRAAGTTQGNPLAFLGANNRLVVEGAVFEVNAPVAAGQDATSYVELRRGTVSYGTSSSWTNCNNSVVGYWNSSYTCAVDMSAVKVNDYVSNQMGRAATASDFKSGGKVYSCTLSADSAYVTVGNGTLKYGTLADAVNAASDGAVLNVYGDLFCPSAFVLTKSVTLKGANATAGLVGLNNNLITLGNVSLTLEGVTLKNAGSSAANATVVMGHDASAYTGSSLTLNGGAKIVNTTGTSGNSNGNGINVACAGNTSITINEGAEITTGGTAIRLEGIAASVTMNGGTITAKYRALLLTHDDASFTMNGGTVEVTTDKGSGGLGRDGGWCICSYAYKPTVTLNGGTLIAVKGANTSLIGACDVSKLTIDSDVVMKYKQGTSEESVLPAANAVAFSDNYMYLYLPDDLTTAEDAVMAFATCVAIAQGYTVREHGMVILPTALLAGEELTVQTDRALKIADPVLTANGYIECGVSDVAAGLSQLGSTMSGRAYVVLTVSLGGVSVDVTVYGNVMSGSGADFANAYKYYHADWASDATVKSVVDTFAALTVTAE